MRRGRRWAILAVAAACCIGLFTACHLEFTSKPLVGPYVLDRFEGNYYILTSSHHPSRDEPGGPLHGNVEELGWNDTHIVAAIERGGWRILDVKTGAVSGVLSRRELAERMRDRPELSSILLQPAKDVWDDLSW